MIAGFAPCGSSPAKVAPAPGRERRLRSPRLHARSCYNRVLPGFIYRGLFTGAPKLNEREVLLELLLARRELLRSIISIESDFIDTLSELQANYEEHAETIAEYRRFLDPLVLWLPSGSRLWKTDFTQIPKEISVLVQAAKGIQVSVQARFDECR